MRGKKLLTTLAVSAVLFAGCGLKSGEAIIKVNNQNITQGQFDAEFDKQAGNGIAKALGIDVKDDKNSFLYMLIKDRVVNELIVKALLNQEMQKRGIEVTNKDVDDAVKEIIDKVGSKEQLDALLKQNGISNSQFKKDLKEEVKMKKLAKELGSSSVSDAEAKKFYNDNISKFKHPDKVRASHILISVNPQEIEEVVKSDPNNKNIDETAVKAKVAAEVQAKEAKANQILAEAKKNPTQFAKLAKENSEDTATANKGGDLGFFAAKEMVPEFSKAAFSMKPNTISDKPVKTQFGYHIIMVTDRSAAGQDPFEKVKPSIKAYLENQKQIELIDKLTESLKKSAKIEYINTSYDPANIQKGVQESIKNSGEAAKKAKEAAEAKKK
ncbi:pPIC-type PPIASE domain protein [Clostridium sp. CAG:715]|jgi:ppiC-type peptidyl-prolyl cis-trans isomerase|nr:pPIC-type PPIASE domain protein [Clostridium sp. CAG:715]